MTTNAAVLSLNGQSQVTLQDDGGMDGKYVQEQHTNKEVPVGSSTLQIMKLLGAMVRIKISDGRLILGRFHCFDKHQNVILTEAREFPPFVDSKGKVVEKQDAEDEWRVQSNAASRSLGMTLVPGKHLVYMKVQTHTS